MTVDEFDIRFDILYNNLASNAAPALNAYEKSVFLSQAQRDIIIELYNGRSIPGISFESTEEARAYLRPLIKDKVLEPIEKNHNNYKYKLDDSIWFITYEELNTQNSLSPKIIPVKQDTLHEIMRNPFKKPSRDRILRVDVNNTIMLLFDDNIIEQYTIFYLENPLPIILKGIDSVDLTIDNVRCDDNPNGSTGSCPEILHQVILERAVALAKKAYIG